tara:strand:+ start:212 stop:466 length:255 start_codon:yes stop_codon:yes gene_type:complete
MRNSLLIILTTFLCSTSTAKAETFYLFYGSYESKERTARIEDFPSLHSTAFNSLERCKAAGEKIFNKIYKPIKFFDGRWTCVEK